MIIRITVLILSLVGFVSTAYSDESKLENNFSGLIQLGGDRSQGNSDNRSLSSNFELGHSYGNWVTDFTFHSSQKKESGTLTEDKYESILKSIYNLPKHYYTFIQLGYREDSFSGVYAEKMYIAGFGYHAFMNKDAYSLDIEIGYGERVTKKLIDGVLRAKVDYDPGTHIALISQYNFTDDDALKASITAEIGNDDDFLKRKFSWVHKLFDAFHLDVSYESLTLSKPSVNKVSTDATTIFKIGYTF
ncbi:MAG: DUF481 domain-containing protein [Ghiorsea sp.]|nr:DUF481 domain-containing protein [Ghiorsea sp.]